MIEPELLEAARDPAESGRRLDEIADPFRRGRDVSDLLALPDAGNAELVSLGAWILSELRFELYGSDRVISRLRRLVGHEDASVRFHALGALFPALGRQDLATGALLSKLRCDPHEVVRQSAEAAAARLSSDQSPL
jgi:hypothetical protein